MSVSSLRWPQTYTTCWSTTDTSWTVEVLSRWRGRERWPLTSSPAVPWAVNESGRPQSGSHCTDRTETSTETEWSTWRWALKQSANALGTGDGRQRRAQPVRLLSRNQMHTCRTLFMFEGFFPQAAREIMKPSCLRTEVAMLVFMSNSTSISSGVVIYFLADGFLWWPCIKKKIYTYKKKTCYLKKYARTRWRMTMTKEQMFDMRTYLRFCSEVQIIYSSFDSKGHGNVTVIFWCGFTHER